ncbi:tripartite tricarboxylate transporter substrate binding protein [Polynucleobacter kasalickyi]|uniref:Tripartite-type tricarboxylate transporter, receptor component TctC n=1 Tax=Polynucleobacter kasalickyi TaxID=1938817 RepID=A0A1W1Y237_9BURK|nr:tripartite tricarboxylate transporter substrate binding protein [Polynucleobacter kasalickyi]SMC30212.1 Tripartite-type tricarboxylate transporter, receptor component TctC [Polynucleobacter kasalickyi]
MIKLFSHRLQIVFLSILSIAAVANATYPEKPIKLIVPFSPGGGTDLVARTVAEGMSRDLNQSVIVENKPGAGTVIGTDYVVKSPADGYTLIVATFAQAVNPSLIKNLPYNASRDLIPVAMVGNSPNVLVVLPNSEFKSVADVIAYAKKNPGKLTYASQGNGTSAHLAGELFTSLAQVEMVHIPYKGASQAITDVLGGQVSMSFATASAAANLVGGGKLKALAVTTKERSTSWPKTPTMIEAGVKDYYMESWYGIFAPVGTPKEVVERLNKAVLQATKTNYFSTRLSEEGLMAKPGSPESFGQYVASEEARWQKIIQNAKIKLD